MCLSCVLILRFMFLVFFFPAPAPSSIYTLSLHDALPISGSDPAERDHDQSDQDEQHRPAPRPLGLQDQEGATEEDPDRQCGGHQESQQTQDRSGQGDRKSTRLNSSHVAISYAVFCLKKKTK